MTRCSGLKGDGGRCERIVTGTNPYCFAHDPALAAARRAAASKAGRTKPSKEIKAIKEKITTLIDEVGSGDRDRNDAAVMLTGYRTLIGYLEMERKVREIDEVRAEIDELKEHYGLSKRTS